MKPSFSRSSALPFVRFERRGRPIIFSISKSRKRPELGDGHDDEHLEVAIEEGWPAAFSRRVNGPLEVFASGRIRFCFAGLRRFRGADAVGHAGRLGFASLKPWDLNDSAESRCATGPRRPGRDTRRFDKAAP